MPKTLQVNNAKKTYQLGKVIVQALNGVSFDVEKRGIPHSLWVFWQRQINTAPFAGSLDHLDEGEILIKETNILKSNDDKL